MSLFQEIADKIISVMVMSSDSGTIGVVNVAVISSCGIKEKPVFVTSFAL
jgi:hypothetical protein